jgi:hypothetical protein
MDQPDSLEPDPPMHLELHTSSADQSPIRVACECGIGRDHTYFDWLLTAEASKTVNRAARPVPGDGPLG